MVTYSQGVLKLWKQHFSTLLHDDKDNADVPNPINNDEMKILPPSHEELKVRIIQPKRINQQSAELFNTKGNELIGDMHQRHIKFF